MKRLCPLHGVWEKSATQSRCPKCSSTYSKSYHKQYDKNHRDKESKKVYDTKQWRVHTRPAILLRDGYRCVKCNILGTSNNLVIDHIKELRDGGDKYNYSNLQTLCISCHKRKTDDEKRKRERK